MPHLGDRIVRTCSKVYLASHLVPSDPLRLLEVGYLAYCAHLQQASHASRVAHTCAACGWEAAHAKAASSGTAGMIEGQGVVTAGKVMAGNAPLIAWF
jgi:hypothetical protein